MTYEINSPWTEMKKNEINELNEIANQRFRIEDEIERKLRIVRAAKKALEKAIDEFNFDVVIRFMKQVGWKWAYTANGEAVPTRMDFIKFFYGGDCLKNALYDMIELNKNHFCVTTGGIIFEMLCGDLSYATEDNTWCSISFDIAHCPNSFSGF